MGGLLTALATSTPELVTTIAAIRIGALTLAVSILTCLVLATRPVHAAEVAEQRQQNTTDEPADTEDAGPAIEPETFPESDNRTRQPNGAEVFIPSEEISEDFAVSFPVDI